MIVLLNFILFRMMPGSPERAALRNPGVSRRLSRTPASGSGWTSRLPGSARRVHHRDAQGDLGYSYKYRGQPVAEVIGARVWPTLILFGLGEIVAIVVGLALGAYRAGDAAARSTTSATGCR